MPERGQHRDVLGSQRRAGDDRGLPGRHVLVGAHDPLSGRDRPDDLDRARHRLLGVLDHHHGVGAVRERAAGRDRDGAVDGHGELGGRAHGHAAGQGEVRRDRLRGAEGVLGADGVAVDAGAVKARQRLAGEDVGGGDAAGGVVQRDGLGGGAVGRAETRPAPRPPSWR